MTDDPWTERERQKPVVGPEPELTYLTPTVPALHCAICGAALILDETTSNVITRHADWHRSIERAFR